MKETFYKIIAHLRFLNIIYHHLHVNSTGPNYYSDHLLFERLYAGADDAEVTPIDEIDRLMEKVSGLYPTEEVSSHLVLQEINQAAQEFDNAAQRVGGSKIGAALSIERNTLSLLTTLADEIEQRPEMKNQKRGVANLLDELADKRQENIYLLFQRVRESRLFS